MSCSRRGMRPRRRPPRPATAPRRLRSAPVSARSCSSSRPIRRTAPAVDPADALAAPISKVGDTYYTPARPSRTSCRRRSTPVRATQSGPDGSVYVLADIDGTTSDQTVKGSQDVALIKYDSAGKVVFHAHAGGQRDRVGLFDGGVVGRQGRHRRHGDRRARYFADDEPGHRHGRQRHHQDDHHQSRHQRRRSQRRRQLRHRLRFRRRRAVDAAARRHRRRPGDQRGVRRRRFGLCRRQDALGDERRQEHDPGRGL